MPTIIVSYTTIPCLIQVYNTVSFQMMIDKLRKRFNHSASLGKTLARTQQQHFSYAEPREFDLHSVNQSKSLSKKPAEPSSTPKPPPALSKAVPAVPANLCIGDGLLSIQLSRARCQQLSTDLHSASMAKSLQLNRMYKEMHHFSVCVEELRWLLVEGDALLRAYLAQAMLVAPRSQHTNDIGHISQEFRNLLLRFQQIDRERLMATEEGRVIGMMGGMAIGASEAFHHRPLPTFPEVDSILSVKQPQAASFLQTRHFSVPLKQNLNTSNLPNFDNIKITKTQSTKPKITTNPLQPTKQSHHDQNHQSNHKNQAHQSHSKQSHHQSHHQINQPMMAHSLKLHERGQDERNDLIKQRQDIRRERGIMQREKQQLYKKLRQQHERNQTLIGSIEMLKEELSSLQRKLTTYKATSKKSIQKLKEILRRLTSLNPSLSPSDYDQQMLKLAQTASGWEKLLQDQQQQAKYRQLYSHPQAIQGQKTTKLQEIIELQYDINDLQARRQQLHRQLQQQMDGRNSEEMYRMLVVQASALEQLCGG